MKNIFEKIFIDHNIFGNLFWESRLNDVLQNVEHLETVKVRSHWNIPFLNYMSHEQWMKTKRKYLVLGILKNLTPWESNRSTEFIMGAANGCLSACSYCYVNRRKKGGNPLTVYLNIDQILDSIIKHSESLGPKQKESQCDPFYWTYDIGCNSDVSLDVLINDNPLYLIQSVANSRFAKISFATKTVNHIWKSVDPKGRTRIRYSLMPQKISKVIDVNTSPISDRIKDINLLVEAGYEVHVNFSPIVVYSPFKQWAKDWIELFEEMNDVLTEKAKSQLKAEIIFLTHSEDAHQQNLAWHPKGEDFLWTPKYQQTKENKPDVICYEYKFKAQMKKCFLSMMKQYINYCSVRYAF